MGKEGLSTCPGGAATRSDLYTYNHTASTSGEEKI